MAAGGSTQHDLEPENQMVGCDDEFGKIKNKVIGQQSSEQLEVISITGMGGIGKTTIAKRVYEDPLIMSHFDIRAWAVVSQEHDVKRILISLLACIVSKGQRYLIVLDDIWSTTAWDEISRGFPDNIDESQILLTTRKKEVAEYGQLADQLRKRLMGQRYLIVIDDIWSTTSWDAIRQCFPDNINGSRILMTTREKEVAEYASSSKYIHSMRFLNSVESWNLFEKKVFEGKHVHIPELETIGRYIVMKCQGLPLAIVVMAGLLRALDKSEQVWRDVAKNMNSLDNVDPNNKCLEILSLSYNYLPSHLKACFFYFGVFPEDRDVLVSKLINLWVAEGFLKKEKEMTKSLEEVAKSYLHNLINRNLVQVSKQSFDGKIKSCKLHDMLHDISVNEAQRENFLSVRKQLQSADSMHSNACRWISCKSTNWPTFDKTRSVFYFGEDVYLSKSKLKVLSICIDNDLPSSAFDSLVHLHFLEKLKFVRRNVERFYLPTALPQHLKKLTLCNTYLPWEDMDVIGRLPKLEVLRLKDFAFSGLEWEPADDGFKRLKLFLIARSDLKCWNATADHFPVLERLILRFCWDLKELPTDFANIYALQLIELDSCYSSLVESAMQIQEEQQSFCGDAFVIRDLGARIKLPNSECSYEENQSCNDESE